MPDDQIDAANGKPNQNRRNVWRSAMVVLGLASGHAIAQTSTQVEAIKRSYWVHGSNLQLLHGDMTEQTIMNGQTKKISGRSFTQTKLLCGLPVSIAADSKGMVVSAALLRIRCGSGAQIQALRLFDGETELACLDQLQIHVDEWQDIRCSFKQAFEIKRGIGLGIDVVFDATERYIDFSALGCEIIA